MTMIWTKSAAAFVAISLCGAVPARAQQALDVKPGKSWTHRHSGISLPASLAGIAKSRGNSYAADELDVSVSYEPEGTSDYLSVYIFRNTNSGVPVWFSQAQWSIEHRDVFGKVAPTTTVAFVPPGQKNASGLKAFYTFDGSRDFKSSGIMLLPVGDWYVKVRLTSKNKSADQLPAIMDRALREIGWPQDLADGPVATPVTNCAAPLTFDAAVKDAPKDGAAGLMGALLEMTAVDVAKKKPKTDMASQPAISWCRDAQFDNNQAIYRANQATDGYMLALGDNGNAVSVRRDQTAGLLAEAPKAGATNASASIPYAVSLIQADKTTSFIPQDRLPSFQRVVSLINGNRVVATVPTWGNNKTIHLNSNAM